MSRPFTPASPRQVEWLRSLARERRLPELGATADERAATLERWLEDGEHDRRWFSTALDAWRHAPYDDTADGVVEPGVYRRDDVIYVVRRNRTNSRVHARRLVEIGGRRLNEVDEVVQIEFVYDPEALQLLRPEDQMTLAEARPFTLRYGRCIACDTPLSDATSVARGIGPVCVKRFAPEPAEPTLSTDQANDLLDRLSRSL